MASTKGSQLLCILASCLVVLFVIIIFIMLSAHDNYLFNLFSDTILDSFNVTPGSFAGWVVMLIVAGILLIAILGTLSVVKYAISLFN